MAKFDRREEALALFRRCLRSARSIRDPEKEQMYESVARDYFRKNMTLLVGSREAYNAYRDGIDQVESMEYYQSMAKCARGGQATTIPRPSVAPVNAANARVSKRRSDGLDKIAPPSHSTTRLGQLLEETDRGWI